MKVTFLGNHSVSYSSETHHCEALESLGHSINRIQEGAINGRDLRAQALEADMFVWVHSHGRPVTNDMRGWPGPAVAMSALLDELRNNAKIVTATYHLDLFAAIPGRWNEYVKHDYIVGGLEHFFTVDSLMADWLNENTRTTGHWLPPGVHEPECYMAKPQNPVDVCFVGSRKYHPEWPDRPKLVDWLEARYAHRFRGYGADFGKSVRGAALNQVYADAKVVVGDSFCPGYNYQGHYWSDRCTETLGRAGFLIHPRVPYMDEVFEDRKHLAYYDFGDMDQLEHLINYYLEHSDEREEIRVTGHEYVKANHTYRQRWATICERITPATMI